MARYIILPRADRDLDDQAAYFAEEADVELALRFLAAAHEPFSLLASQPHMGSRCRLRHPKLRAARALRIGGFERTLVFYRPSGNVIEIVRVLHGSQDLEALFEREGVQ